MVRIAFVVFLLAAACTGEPVVEATTSTDAAELPRDAEEALLEMLVDIAAGTGAPVIDERQIVLLAGAEGATTDEIADLFTSVGSGRVTVNFWGGFAEGVALDALDVDEVRVGRVEEFQAGGFERRSIELWDAGRQANRTWHLARVDGEWRLDLFATFGDVYAGPLRLLIRSLDPGSEGFPAVSEALADQRASLELAPPTDARLEISSELADLP